MSESELLENNNAKNANGTIFDPSPFHQIENNLQVIPLLKSRCPQDAQVLNMALFYPKYLEFMNIYIWNGTGNESTEIGNSTWIVITSIREDFGLDIAVSIPPETEMTDELKEILADCKIFHWEEPHLFVAIPRPFSKLVTEINTHIKGNIARVSPCSLWSIDPKEAQKLTISPPEHNNEIIIQSLDADKGAQFICDNWKYANSKSLDYLKRFMVTNPSCGVVDKETGQIASGVVVGNNGLLGMLFTGEKYRNKRYATLVMQSLIKDLAVQGFFPCSAIDMFNAVSYAFHAKIGMKFSHYVDFVRFDGVDPK